MYRSTAVLVIIALTMIFTDAFAQEFSFKSTPAAYTPSTSTKDSALSPQEFADKSTEAYQEQQAKVAARVAEKVKAAEMNEARAKAQQKPQTTTAPQQPIRKESPSTMTSTTPAPAEAPPTRSPTTQPYTGFQSPPPASTGGGYNSGSTPSNNNQNSGGWGSSIKY